MILTTYVQSNAMYDILCCYLFGTAWITVISQHMPTPMFRKTLWFQVFKHALDAAACGSKKGN